jgi:hypothetical protein
MKNSVARFVLVQHTKTGKMNQITIKFTKCPQNISNASKIDQKVIKYTSIFHCKFLQNLPKSWFLVWKYAIWQPWIEKGDGLSFLKCFYPICTFTERVSTDKFVCRRFVQTRAVRSKKTFSFQTKDEKGSNVM